MISSRQNSFRKSFVIYGVSNALDNSKDEDINVLKPDGLLHGSREEILQPKKEDIGMTTADSLPSHETEEGEDGHEENGLVIVDDDDVLESTDQP